MQVNWKTLLLTLGCNVTNTSVEVKHPCPLHPSDDASLSVRLGDDISFCCDNPRCRFEGSALELVAKTLKLDPAAAALEFTGSGVAASALDVPLTSVEAAELGREQAQQMNIRAWLSSCHTELCNQDVSVLERFGLPGRTDQLPSELGLCTQQDNVLPAYFNRWANTTLLYPFTYHGYVQSIVFQGAVNMQQPNAVYVAGDAQRGMFMERNIDGAVASTMLLTFWPAAAAALAAKLNSISSKLPAVAAISGFPLPHAYNYGLKHAVLFSTPNYPVSLERALQTFIYQRTHTPAPTFWVKQLDSEVSALSTESLMRGITQDKRGRSLEQYLVSEIERIAGVGTLTEKTGLVEVWDSVLPSEAITTRLIKVADDARAQAAKSFLVERKTQDCGCLRLGNGASVLALQDCVLGVKEGSKEKLLLADTGLRFDYKECEADGVVYVGTAYVKGSKGPVTFSIRDSDIRKADSIERVITRAYAEKGESPYVAVYNVSGFTWNDIVLRLAATCEVRKRASTCGAIASNQIRLPGLQLDVVSGNTQASDFCSTEETALRTVYDGLLLHGSKDLTAFQPVFESENAYVRAMALVLSHIVSQQAHALYYASRSKPFTTRHLLLVEPEQGYWEPLIRQLTMLLGDNEFPLVVAAGSDLSDFKGLGSLPLLGQCTPMKGDKATDLLNRSQTGLVLSVDDFTAAAINCSRCAYVTAAADITPSYIDGHALERMRHAFAELLLQGVKHIDVSMGGRASKLQVADAYKSLCTGLGFNALATTEIVSAYTGKSSASVFDFFSAVYRAVHVDRSVDESVAETTGPLRTDIVIRPTTVAVKKSVVGELATTSCHKYFNCNDLHDKFVQHQFLATAAVDADHWEIKKDVWDRYVTTPSLFYTAPTATVTLPATGGTNRATSS